MHSLIVVEQLRRKVPGGIGTYIEGLLQGLRQISHMDRTLLASRSSQRPDPLDRFGLPVQTVALPSPLVTRLWDRDRMAVSGAFDIVHATAGAFPAPGKAPMTAMVHDLAWQHVPEAYPPRGLRWHALSLERARRHARVLIVPAQQTADDLLERGVAPDQVAVIPEGADHLPAPDMHGAKSVLERVGVHGEFLLAVGTLEPRKNLRRLADAYRQARSQLPEPWPLVIVGPAGWGEDFVAAEGVIALGRLDMPLVVGLYATCRTFVSVPLLEGYGLPVLEAMSQGAPVVASAVPSAGDAAFIVDPQDEDDIAAGIVKVSTDETLREDLRQRGAAHAARTTWSACAQAHVDIWEQLHGEG